MQINVIEYFENTLKNSSEKTAVIDGDRTITFGELAEKSQLLSRVIAQDTKGVVRKPIAVFLPKSIEVVMSDLGIIYSGNAYMNLDVKTPVNRIQAILNRIQPLLIITDTAHKEQLSAIWPLNKILLIDEVAFEQNEVNYEVINKVLYPIIDTDPLCIINTSGSTGTPKGVVLNHRSFIDFTDWANNIMQFGDDEIIGCLSPVVFDIYSYELCLMMSKGAAMVLLQDDMAIFPATILKRMIECQVSFIFWVPTIMVNIANMGLLDKIVPDSLRTVWFAGEVFPTKQFNIWRRVLPQARFVNMYGPIEITLDCTHYIVERELSDNEPIPIGQAMRNTDILILNDNNQLCQAGEEGELCVRGSSLAMGYYNDPEKTAAAFVQNPLNNAYPELIYRTGDIACVNDLGEIIFKGRKDTLVKHSGYRIELGEIEHIIVSKLKLVENGCVIYDYAKKEIVFFYEARDDIKAAEFRRVLAVELPKYMLPTRYVCLEEMPRNTNGKIDRLKLKGELNG